MAAEVPAPDSDGGVVGGGVENAVVGDGDRVDWLGVRFDGLYAFQV